MMKKFLNLDEDRRLNEIIFANRNKEYGAYALRNEESSVLKKSLFLGVAFFITMSAIPLVMNSFKGEVIPDEEWPGTFNPVDIPVDPDPVQPVKPDPVPPKPVETFAATVPTPTHNPPVETPSPTVDRYDDARAGFVDSEGEKPTQAYVPPVVAPTVPGPSVPAPQPAADPDAIVETVDVKAVFGGGFESFRNKVSQNMDISYFEDSGERLTSKVTFIVEKDGSISNIKALGNDKMFNKEAEQAVRAVRGKWTPAKLKGQAVRSYFSIPITIQFE